MLGIIKKLREIEVWSNYSYIKRKNNVACFDFFRAIACLGIAICHYSFTHRGLFTNRYFSIYDIFMAMFFFTTGYLIPMSIERCNWKQFAVKRFFRLIPVLWFMVVIAIFVVFIVKPYNKQILSPINVFSTMFMVNDIKWIFYDILGITTHKENFDIFIFSSWSLQVELKYYIIVAIFYYIFKNSKKTFYSITTIVLLLQLSRIDQNFTYKFHFGYVIRCILYILIGHAFYLFKSNKISKQELILWFLCFIIIANLTMLDVKKRYHTGYIIGILICIYFVIQNPEFGNNKIVRFFANCSYSLYLLHCILLNFIIENYDYLYHNRLYKYLILLSLIPICHLIYKYIEKPMYDYGRRLASKIK